MASLYSNAVLPQDKHTSLSGDSAKYQSTGGNGLGYGFTGSAIRPGVMEFTKTTVGGSSRRRKSKRVRRNKNRKSRRRNH